MKNKGFDRKFLILAFFVFNVTYGFLCTRFEGFCLMNCCQKIHAMETQYESGSDCCCSAVDAGSKQIFNRSAFGLESQNGFPVYALGTFAASRVPELALFLEKNHANQIEAPPRYILNASFLI